MIDQEEIHKQCFSNDTEEHTKALEQLKNSFSLLPDKQQAWNDLHRLTNDEDSYVRARTAYTLGSVFLQVPDKQQAWNDLIELAIDKNLSVKYQAVNVLSSVISQVPDKQQAWNDLIRLTSDKNGYVRYKATHALGLIFSQILDKQQAWEELHILTTDHDKYVRHWIAYALASVISQVPDKQQVWNDLIRFTSDKNSSVRRAAAHNLASAFYYVPDKKQASNNLHRLTTNRDNLVRSRIASALGSVFSQVSDKQQAWNDLIRLTTDKDRDVRAFANHSLGKVSIYMASQVENEEDYKEELEKAIEFFGKAAQESIHDNPAQFCLPFYRSFHTIIFEKRGEKEEVNKYLTEAKDAIKGSQSKELLFETVKHLANALKEVQNIENIDFEAKKDKLSFYRTYFDYAEKLMRDAEERVPFTVEAVRKGLPILDRNLKVLLEEIQKKTKNACEELQGTPNAEIACKIYGKVKNLVTSNPEEADQNIEDIAFTIINQVPDIPEYILNKIDQMISENDLTKKTQILSYVMSYIIGQMLKENQVSMNIDGNANNVIVNSNDSKIIVNAVKKGQDKSGFIDSSATRASFLGFIVLELLNIIRPLGSTNHIICLSAIIIYLLVSFIIYKI